MVGDFLARLWVNLAGGVGGRLTFRLILQPTVAAVFAVRAGLSDMSEGRAPYGSLVLTDLASRSDLLREAWKDVAKVFTVAVIIDFVYQILEFRWLYPGEAALVAAALALLPYLLLRGPANRIAFRWRRHHRS